MSRHEIVNMIIAVQTLFILWLCLTNHSPLHFTTFLTLTVMSVLVYGALSRAA
jgi:hypothetical protein